jgi:hypothetical protein
MNSVSMADRRSRWVAGHAYMFRQWTIHCVEENGRRFFTTTDPTPVGWTLSQEFGSVDSAMRHIEGREIDKMLYRIGGGTNRVTA